MIDIDDTDSGLYIADIAKNEMTIRTDGWMAGGTPQSLPRYVDVVIAGTVSQLWFPGSVVAIEGASDDRWQLISDERYSLRFDPEDYVVKIEGPVVTYLRFHASIRIERNGNGGEVHLTFPSDTPVTIGFRSEVRTPSETIATPPTAEGVSTAVTALSTAIETTTPDKSYPSLRRHPPAIEFDERTRIPDAIEEKLPDTGIEIRVPADIDSLFVFAPLAYYLQADLISESRTSAVLQAPDTNVYHTFSPLPVGQHEAADLLRRVFSLDCLVRNFGPYPTALEELSLLNSIPLDGPSAYEASPSERLGRYLETPFERIEAELPGWHLAMYIDPMLANVPSLSHHLDHLSLIYLPSAERIDKGQYLERSLDDFYRSSNKHRGAGHPDALLPRFRDEAARGWMTDGVPIEAFKTIRQSYENQASYIERRARSKAISVVLNDPEMEAEQVSVSEIYRERANELSIDLTIHRQLDRDGLIEVFRNGADFLHFIGHCTSSGLQCTDGHLSIDEIESVDVQIFFLNACGSYEQGIALVEKGSVAGAVTLEKVLHSQATKVGIAFGRLVVHGFNIDRALDIARRQAIVNKGYLTVGDGTHSISQGVDKHPVTLVVDPNSLGRFSVTSVAFSLQHPGGIHQSYLPEDTDFHLFGNDVDLDVSRGNLLDLLIEAHAPVIYEGRYYWSDDLYDELLAEGV